MRKRKKRASDIIRIPRRLHKYPLTKLNVSARLTNLWRKKGFKVLGDIHGMAFNDYLNYHYFGGKSVDELRSLVDLLQSGHEPRRQPRQSALWVDHFSVAPQAAGLKVADLPISVRLGHVLEKKGVKKLGDVDGLEIRQLLHLRNCGERTISELTTLLDRAASGEFQPETTRFSPSDARAIIEWIDRVMETIEARDRTIFVARFAAKQWGKPTLEKAGAKYGLTRERVRQIETEVVSAVRQQGGPWGASRLQALAKFCRDEKLVITPELLASWLRGRSATPRHPLVMYVRMLGRLDPKLAVHPRAETAEEKQRRLAGKPLVT